jgi:hypothetical protein
VVDHRIGDLLGSALLDEAVRADNLGLIAQLRQAERTWASSHPSLDRIQAGDPDGVAMVKTRVAGASDPDAPRVVSTTGTLLSAAGLQVDP